MRWIDQGIAQISPVWALKRAKARRELARYDGATPSEQHLWRNNLRSRGDPNTALFGAKQTLVEKARKLDQDHDLVTSLLSNLVDGAIGPTGITIMPMPRTREGDLFRDLADEIKAYLMQFESAPEMSGQYDMAALDRLAFRSTMRDGECFVQQYQRRAPTNLIPYALKAYESDYCPSDIDVNPDDFYMGVRRNQFARPLQYKFYREHPGSINASHEFIIINAGNIFHLKYATRLDQIRGVTILAPILNRAAGIKRLEEAEDTAAQLGASIGGYIKRGTADMYEEPSEADSLQYEMQPGIFYDNLPVGAEIEMLNPSRPNPNLVDYRNNQLRAMCTGAMASYSAVSRNYDGSYSAMRQERLDQHRIYKGLTHLHVQMFTRKWVRGLVATLIENDMLETLRGAGIRELDMRTVYDAEYLGPPMEWIDPENQANTTIKMIRARIRSRASFQREMGLDPEMMRDEIAKERERDQAVGIPVTDEELQAEIDNAA